MELRQTSIDGKWGPAFASRLEQSHSHPGVHVLSPDFTSNRLRAPRFSQALPHRGKAGSRVSESASKRSQRLAYAQAQHEALPDLHGIAAGRGGPRLVIDANADQRRLGRGERSIDQPLE